MFERFTDQARTVVVLAQEEARKLSHRHIGTEHILLGLVCEDDGLAAHVLRSLDVTVEPVRARVLRIVGSGASPTIGMIPFSTRAKKVLELALREAIDLGHKDVGTEHILLGMVRENQGVASRILLELGADSETVRDEMIRQLPASRGAELSVPRPNASAAPQSVQIAGATLLAELAPTIRGRLGRDPDAGDLLVVLQSIRDSVIARALAELGIDEEALDNALARARAQNPGPVRYERHDRFLARLQARFGLGQDPGSRSPEKASSRSSESASTGR